MQVSIDSLYSAVVKDVMSSIASQPYDLEESLISEIQTQWMSNYSSLAGSQLDLSENSEEDVTQQEKKKKTKVVEGWRVLICRSPMSLTVTPHNQHCSLVTSCR